MVVAPHSGPSAARLTTAEADLVRLAVELGALTAGGPLSRGEDELVNDAALALPGSRMTRRPSPGLASLSFETPSAAVLIPLAMNSFGSDLPLSGGRSARSPPSIVRPMVDWGWPATRLAWSTLAAAPAALL